MFFHCNKVSIYDNIYQKLIDDGLKKIKKDMHNNFTVKLSKHKHADEHCIRTVTFDGN